MPRRPDLPTRDEMEGESEGAAVLAPPPPRPAPVAAPPPQPAKKAVPTEVVEIPGVPYPDFVLLVMKSYLGGPLGLAAFSGTLLFTEAPRLYRKMARLIAQGVYGDVLFANMTDAEKRVLERGPQS